MGDKKQNKGFVKGYLIPIMIGILLALFIKTFVADTANINGLSMYPTYDNGNKIIVEKISYRFEEPKINDIVVVIDSDYKKRIIKRIVAVAGDKIEIKNGRLIRNGSVVEETYIKEKMLDDFPIITIPNDHVFVLGDNRNHSLDSRVLGPIELSEIESRAFKKLF